MSLLKQFFKDPSDPAYTYDHSLIEIAGGDAHLLKSYRNPDDIVYGILPTSDDAGAIDLAMATNGLRGDYCQLVTATPLMANLKFDLLTVQKLDKIKILRKLGSIYSYLLIRVSSDLLNWDIIYNSDSANLLAFGVGTNQKYRETGVPVEFDVMGKEVRYIEIYSGPDQNGLNEFDEINCYAFTYPLKAPVIRLKLPFNINVLTGITDLETVINSEIKFNMQFDDIVYYHNGLYWERYNETVFNSMINSGKAYYKTNTLAQILANITGLLNHLVLRQATLIIHLRSIDGTASPTISWVEWNYDIDRSQFLFDNIVEVFGSVLDLSGNPPLTPLKVYARLLNTSVLDHKTLGYETYYNSIISTTTNVEDGTFTLPLIKTSGFVNSKNAKWQVTIDTIGAYPKAFPIPEGTVGPVAIRQLLEQA